MPTYQATFDSEGSMTIRNYYAPTIGECIDKVLEAEKGDWIGVVVSVKLVEVENVRW